MHRHLRHGIPPRLAQHGFSMLEILVTLFLVTMWLLGTAGLQASALKLNTAAQFRTQAVFLASEIAERMQANRGAAVAGLYALAAGAATTMPVNCMTTACTPEDLAAFDLAEWSGRVSAVLPNATMTLAVDAVDANPITYTIVIGWTDRREERKYETSGTNESFSYTATRTIFNEPT